MRNETYYLMIGHEKWVSNPLPSAKKIAPFSQFQVVGLAQKIYLIGQQAQIAF